MAKHDSPPDSPLSSMASEDDYEDDALTDELPPPKRLKVGAGSAASSAVVAVEPEPEPDPLEGMSPVSSDTEGDVPSSPINARLDEDEHQEQVTTCAWEGCKVGDLGDMDRLVEHIHNDHIEGKQKKYTCEWVGCARKSMAHASGYALKAHMRSHTREKPFYCYLPECDRAFTRSDALAKHMRTVHETEALRPSDPVPKSMQLSAVGSGAGGGLGGTPTTIKNPKLKIIIKTPQSHVTGHDDSFDDGHGYHRHNGDESSDFFTPLTEEQGFTKEELQMPLDRLHGLCRFQVRWATRDGEELRRECEQWEELYRKEWLEKQALLEQVGQSEESWYERRKAVLAGAADIQMVMDAAAAEEAEEGGGEAGGGEDKEAANGDDDKAAEPEVAAAAATAAKESSDDSTATAALAEGDVDG